MACARGKSASGKPIRWVIWAAAAAWTIAWGSARPTSSEARMQSRRAMNSGSAPPSIIRASQYKAALASEFRTDLIRAEARL